MPDPDEQLPQDASPGGSVPLSAGTARSNAPEPYDAERVALAAQAQDPGLPPETASLLAGRAWPLLQDIGELDAPELARRLMADARVGATPANVVATSAVEHCRQAGLQP